MIIVSIKQQSSFKRTGIYIVPIFIFPLCFEISKCSRYSIPERAGYPKDVAGT